MYLDFPCLPVMAGKNPTRNSVLLVVAQSPFRERHEKEDRTKDGACIHVDLGCFSCLEGVDASSSPSAPFRRRFSCANSQAS